MSRWKFFFKTLWAKKLAKRWLLLKKSSGRMKINYCTASGEWHSAKLYIGNSNSTKISCKKIMMIWIVVLYAKIKSGLTIFASYISWERLLIKISERFLLRVGCYSADTSVQPTLQPTSANVYSNISTNISTNTAPNTSARRFRQHFHKQYSARLPLPLPIPHGIPWWNQDSQERTTRIGCARTG